MNKLRKTFLVMGISLCAISMLLLIVLAIFPDTYFMVALSNIVVIPIVWGVSFIILSFLIKREKMLTKTIIKKALLLFLLIIIIKSTANNPWMIAIRDLQAVMSDDLYVAEGVVIDTYIERQSGSQINHLSSRDRYLQHIIMDNEQQDEFIIDVDHKDDYVFQIGETYRMIALPYSRDILEYEKD